MGTAFWVRRFFVVLGWAFLVITVAQLVRGRDARYALSEGALWGLITATVFIAARTWQSRRKQHCAICRDTPEMREPRQPDGVPFDRPPSA